MGLGLLIDMNELFEWARWKDDHLKSPTKERKEFKFLKMCHSLSLSLKFKNQTSRFSLLEMNWRKKKKSKNEYR